MRLMVLGAGQQGSACAYDLLANSTHDVVLADLNPSKVAPFLDPYVGGRLERLRLDVTDAVSVRDAMVGVDVTLSAVPYHHNLALTEAALGAGSHFCDLGGNTKIVLRQRQLHPAAVAAGLVVVPDCGLAPGMVNIIAAHGIRQFDRVHEVLMKVGGLPQRPEPPLKYQIVYSLEGVIDYYTTRSWILRNGALVQVEALSEVEEAFFPAIGALEAFHTAGGLSLMAQSYAGTVNRMEYKTLRYPGHAEAMRTVRELGLLSATPLEVNGVEVIPRDVFMAAAGPKLRKDPQQSPDLVALRIDVSGEAGGEDLTLRWDLLDRFDPTTGITAMMRTTGFSLSITGLMLAAGKIRAGVWTPDEMIPAEEYLSELAGRGIEVRSEVVLREVSPSS